MKDPLPNVEDIKMATDRLGQGTLVGAGIGLVAGGIALFSGMFKNWGWWRWLTLPVAAIIGGITGDAVKQDGQIFGPNGMVNTMRRRNGPKSIPEGHIAPNVDSHTFAVDSATLARNGNVHSPGVKSRNANELYFGYKEERALDDFVEFSISGDKRLDDPKDGLKNKARSYKEKFKHITDVRERERAITNAIIRDIGDTYGEYSDKTADAGNLEESKATTGWRSVVFGGRTTELKNMPFGSLVCRHYAPIVSCLLHEAGVKNHLVTSYVGYARRTQEGKGEDIERVNSTKLDYHMYVVTDEGNAIVEATVAGADRARSIEYRPIINNVHVKDIVMDGKAAIVMPSASGYRTFIYGGHNGNGYEGMKEAQIKSVEDCNKLLKEQKEAMVEMLKVLPSAIGLPFSPFTLPILPFEKAKSAPRK